MVVTITEAIEGDGMAMIAVGLAATPVDNVAGVAKKVIKGSHVVEMFSPVLQPVIKTILGGRYRIDRIKRAEVMLATGELALADWHKLVKSGIFNQSKIYSRYLAREAKKLSGSLRPKGTVLHHYLPLDKRFEMRFISAGLDPNDPRFTEWVEFGKHIGWHKGSGPGGDYNREWLKFFTEKPEANAAEILAKLNQLRQTYAP
jgi:hypothetical protein